MKIVSTVKMVMMKIVVCSCKRRYYLRINMTGNMLCWLLYLSRFDMPCN